MRYCVTVPFSLIFSFPFQTFSSDQNLPRVGWVEKAIFYFSNDGKTIPIELDAKIDTGARTSSIHGMRTSKVTKGEKTYAKFLIQVNGVPIEIEAPLLKVDSVKTSDSEEGEGRYFVEAEVCIGKVRTPVILTINDRSKMQYPALIGRRFLENRFLVDAAKKSLQGKPLCTADSKK